VGRVQLVHPERLSPDMAELAAFFAYCRTVDDLRNYTVLNYIGVLKILKKYDKKTGTAIPCPPAAPCGCIARDPC
jgi:SPX domain protein involved in polyphosphate accumulation